MRTAVSDEDWATAPRTAVEIRREKFLEDALREAAKSRFDPTRLLKVC